MTRKRVTMKDIADKLNLSINAVSLALNDKTGVGEETKRLILNTAEEMGYLDQSVKYMQKDVYKRHPLFSVYTDYSMTDRKINMNF